MEKDRTVGEQMVGDLGLDPGLGSLGSGNNARLEKLRQFHKEDAEASAEDAGDREDGPE